LQTGGSGLKCPDASPGGAVFDGDNTMRVPTRLLLLILIAIVGLPILFLYVERRPFFFANTTYLGGIIALEVIAVCLWHYEKVFLPVTMWTFLAAAVALPLSGASYTLRWVFLAIGAFAGFVLWIKTNRERHFGVFHLVALFCVFSAMASASSSAAAKTGLLKTGSLFLLFLYAATGGRLALWGRERSFLRGLTMACEVAAFVSGAAYLTGYDLFGNPNNMGAFIGVLVVPVLLWSVVTTEDSTERRRRLLALAICGGLLYASVCRSAIVAVFAVTATVTMALRRPGLVLKTAFVIALFVEIMAVGNPSRVSAWVDSFAGRFVFKNIGTHNGLFGSRQSPWDDTIAAVKQHPLFGTGFGTSALGTEQRSSRESDISTVYGTNREHGSSYLAMAEYMGLLGILPFLLLLALLVRNILRMFAWMRRTGTAAHWGAPFALITLAGLIHAGFEDWLFAPGSYLCVFFWVSAFLLIDCAQSARSDLRMVSLRPTPAFTRAAGIGRSA
jgi:O-antigen ligase